MGAPARPPSIRIPATYSFTYKMVFYGEDGYVTVDTLTQEEQQEFEENLLQILMIGSIIEPINCPVHGLNINWNASSATLTLQTEDTPSLEPRPACTRNSLAGFVNNEIISAGEYVMELH